MSEDADADEATDAVDSADETADDAPETDDVPYTDVDPTVDDGTDEAAVDPDEWRTGERSDDVDRGLTRGGPDPFADIDASPGGGDPFEAIDVEPVDEDVLWDDLVGGDADALVAGDAAVGSTAGGDPPATGPAVAVEDDEAVVPKRAYCEGCEHFSAPPETACTHPGTEIRELVDVEHFRVVNCPVVERRRRIGESTED